MINQRISYITPTNTQRLKQQLIDYSSRYQKSRMIFYSDFDLLTFETYDRSYNPSSESNRRIKEGDFKYYQITRGTQYKPWLVSQEAYRDPGYWWFLMEFNNIFDVEDFKAGKTIKIPNLSIVNENAPIQFNGF